MNLYFLFFALLLSILYINIVEARWKPKPGTTWNYVLGNDVDISKEKAQVVDIDVKKSAKKIHDLHKANIKVICYFSAGTVEKFRDDYEDFIKVKGLVQNRYDAWPDERWLDFRVAGIRPLIRKRMKLAVSKKCDGIEVDNLDGYQMREVKRWKKPLTRDDTIKYAKWLAYTAHEYGISIGLKNVPGIIDRVGKYFDFAINESCIKHNECYLYNDFLKSGKAVFGVTYNGLSRHRNALCKNLNGLGMSMIVKETSSLVQKGTIFNGKKHCGSYFSNAVGKGVKPGSKTTTRRTTTKRRTTAKKRTTRKRTSKRRTTRRHTTRRLSTLKRTTKRRITTKRRVVTKKHVTRRPSNRRHTTRRHHHH